MKIKSLIMALLIVLSILPIASAEQVDDVECLQNQAVNCIFEQPKIDVVFVIDSTGSMADEIRTVKTHLTQIIKEVENGLINFSHHVEILEVAAIPSASTSPTTLMEPERSKKAFAFSEQKEIKLFNIHPHCLFVKFPIQRNFFNLLIMSS